MKIRFAYRAILACIFLCVTNVNAFEMRLSGDLFSLNADKVPIQQILQRLTDRGIKVRIDPQLNPKITASFKNRDMQDALASILKPVSYVLIWESIEGPNGSIPKLAEIQVFMPGKQGLMKTLGHGNRSIGKNPADGSLYIKNEILLELKLAMSPLEFQKLLRKFNATITDGNAALGIYRIRLPDGSDVPSLVEQITNHPGVAKAEPNYAYPVTTPDKVQKAIPPLPGFSDYRPLGSAPVAILDTGLASGFGLEEFVLDSLDALEPGGKISDSLGHGTQMALIASGIVKPYGYRAPQPEINTQVIPIRVFDDKGFTSNFDIMEGINFALDKGAPVISLSWGSETRSSFLEKSMNYAKSNGLIVVASAGNAPTGKPVYPAAYSSVIAVGALGPNGKIWKKSNYGDFVRLYAPGLATLPVGYNGDPGTYAGTSISAAFVANMISNHLSKNPNATIDEILKTIESGS